MIHMHLTVETFRLLGRFSQNYYLHALTINPLFLIACYMW